MNWYEKITNAVENSWFQKAINYCTNTIFFPGFKSMTNPTVNISDMKVRRFHIIDKRRIKPQWD